MSDALWNQQQKVYYDGYQLPVTTINYTTKPEYDSTGNILQGYTITFKMQVYFIENSNGAMAARLSDLLAILSRPRREFLWNISGDVFFGCIAAEVASASKLDTSNYYSDRRWGPKPRIANMERHTNGKSARLQVEIECFCNMCPGEFVSEGGNSATASDFEEAWWTFSYAMDMNYSCTRTVNGKYRLRSPLNAGEILAFGGYFPSLPKSFFRDTIRHDLSADGLVLSFTIIDKQRWRTLPRPLTAGSATFSMVTQGAMMKRTLRGYFEAPNNVNKRVIYQFIYALIGARFPDLSAGKAIVKEWKVENEEFENKISFSIMTETSAAMMLDDKGNFQLGQISSIGWGDVMDVTPAANHEWEKIDGFANLLPITGTANLIPTALPPWQMCAEGTAVPGDRWEPTPFNPGYAGGPGSSDGRSDSSNPEGSDPSSTEKTTIWSDAHNDAPFVSFEERILYQLRTGVVTQLSTGATGGNIKQQMHQPTVTVIQSGCATRYRIPPEAPEPIFTGSIDGTAADGFMVKKDVATTAPKFVGDALTPVHNISWCYTMTVPGATKLNDDTAGADNVDILIPVNPMINYNNATVMANLTNYQGKVKSTAVGSDGSFQGYYPNIGIDYES